MQRNKEMLPALNGLRVLATAGIFLFHSGFLLNGTFPVTLFFMLSGFMMYYTKRNTIEPFTGLKKMKKMYPLHFLTFLLAILIWNPWKKYSMDFILKSGILQLTLLQAWFPKYTMTYNGLAWYLSVTLFLYLISFPLVNATKQIKKPGIAAAILVAIEILLNLLNRIGGENQYIYESNLSYF